MYFDVDGVKILLDKNLHLNIPTVEDLTKVLYLSGVQAGELQYNVDENGIVKLDLNAIEGDVSAIVFTQKIAFLKPWQIILIVSLSVAVIGGGVATFIVLRKRKIKKYSENEKI